MLVYLKPIASLFQRLFLGDTYHNAVPLSASERFIEIAPLELVKIELSVLLEEYKALRADYLQHTTFAQQTLVITFAAIGGVLAGTKEIYQPSRAIIYLVASYVFFALTWNHLRFVQWNVAVRNHIIEIGRAVRQRIVEIAPERCSSLDILLKSEEVLITTGYPKRELSLIALARYGIPLTAAIATFIAFVTKTTVRPIYLYSLVVLESILFVYTSYVICKVGTSAIKVSTAEQKFAHPAKPNNQ